MGFSKGRNTRGRRTSAVSGFRTCSSPATMRRSRNGARRKRGHANTTFTVRKMSYGVGVERIFPLYSPRIDKIEVVASGKVKRARLFYLRELQGKAARLKSAEEGGAAQ